MKRSYRTSSQMYPVVEAYLEGGQTQEAFCAERELPASALRYWLAKYRREQAVETEAFMEIAPVGGEADHPILEIAYPRGLRVRLFAPVPPAYLELLLGA